MFNSPPPEPKITYRREIGKKANVIVGVVENRAMGLALTLTNTMYYELSAPYDVRSEVCEILRKKGYVVEKCFWRSFLKSVQAGARDLMIYKISW